MVDLPDGEKIVKIRLSVLTQSTNVAGGQTHTQTPHDGISRALMHSIGRQLLTDTVCVTNSQSSRSQNQHVPACLSVYRQRGTPGACSTGN